MKILVMKFGSKVCPACISMDRSKTLERLAEAHPNEVEIIKLDVADEEGENPRGTTYDDAYKLSDEYEVTSLPTLIFMSADGGELAREEGGLSYRQIEKLFEEAKEGAALVAEAKKIAAEQGNESTKKARVA